MPKMTFPGRPDFVAVARAGIRKLLGDAPERIAEHAELIGSELVTNAVLWSRSGLERGTVTLDVEHGPGTVRIEVTDGGKLPVRPGAPADFDRDQHGRGLEIVDALAKEWGQRDGRGRSVYWAVLTWDEPAASTEGDPCADRPPAT